MKQSKGQARQETGEDVSMYLDRHSEQSEEEEQTPQLLKQAPGIVVLVS